MKIKFFKYQGAGNDFILVDKISDPDLTIETQSLSSKICDRHYGVGADGLVLLSKRQDTLVWEFFNSDGSIASMCGNAARCVAHHLYKQHHLTSAILQTGAGVIRLQKEKEQYSVEMPAYKEFQHVKNNVYFVNTGVPHFVVSLTKEDDVLSYIKEYRWHPIAGDRGANVSFYYLDNNIYKAKTFERGVEGFTLACGTGAAACGLVIYKQKPQTSISISMPGGDLEVRVVNETIYLIGTAEAICHGEYYV